MTTRDVSGFLICQAVGCEEPATPWATTIDLQGVEIELTLCRRHDNDLMGARGQRPEPPPEVES
jgi:hypothetical protein